MSKTLILWRGMEFHEPELFSDRFATRYRFRRFEVSITNHINVRDDVGRLGHYHLIVMNMTTENISH